MHVFAAQSYLVRVAQEGDEIRLCAILNFRGVIAIERDKRHEGVGRFRLLRSHSVGMLQLVSLSITRTRSKFFIIETGVLRALPCYCFHIAKGRIHAEDERLQRT